MEDRPPLLERESALSALDQALERTLQGGDGGVVLVQGEAGIGKTALVRRFAADEAGRARFLHGACDPLSTPRPLGPLRDVAPDLGQRVPQALALEAGRAELFAAVHEELSAAGPVRVLVFEDLHWADEATLDLLRFLGRRIEHLPALLIGTFRDDEVSCDHPLRRALGVLPRSAVRRIALAPLSPGAVEELAARAGKSAQGIHRLTGGNPFFVSEVLASREEVVPVSVRDAVLARVAALPAGARSIAEVVSAVPGRAERWLTEAVAAPTARDWDACARSGPLVLGEGTLAFRHELARLAVLESLPPGARREIHARCLSALRARTETSGDLSRLAHHAVGAEDDAAILAHAPGAAREAAAVGAHREAVAHYRSALRASSQASASARAELLEAHAYECYLTSAIEPALESRHAALELRQKLGDPTGVGRDLRWLSRLSWFLGREREARSYAEEALRVLEQEPHGVERAWALSNRSQIHMLANEVAPALEWGARAIELAEAQGESEVLVHALNNRGTARLSSGDGGGRAELERSLELARAHGFEEHVARAYTNLAATAVELWDYEYALRTLEEGIAYAVERDLDSWSDYMRAYRARAHLELGSWERSAEEAAALLDRPGAPAVLRLPALTVLGHLRARRGDPGARSALDESLELARGTGELQRLVPVALARAETAWIAGERERVVEEVRPAHELARAKSCLRVEGMLASWLTRAGERVALPRETPLPCALETAGEWRAASQAWERARRPFERALALAEGDEAAKLQALELLIEFGAAPAVERLRCTLRERGVRRLPRGPRPSTRANAAGLTVRQMEVLACLSEGLTYGEIARRLFVAPKTVEHHVAAILQRLAVPSSREAVEQARLRGLLPRDGGGRAPR